MRIFIACALTAVFTRAPALTGQEPPPAAREAPRPAGEAPAAPGVAGAEEVGGPEAPVLGTRITAVTLYSAEALVVRTGAVEVPAGRSRWEVSALPAALVDEAVRARVVQGAGARLANLEVRERKKTLFRKKEAEEAEAALKGLQARHRAAADGLAALEREAALLKGFEVGKRPEGRPEKQAATPIDVGAWDAALKFVDQALTENRRRARELLVEQDGIEEELAVAADRARKLQSGKVRAEKAVVLELDAAARTQVELEVAYLVPGPGWWPRYDIRAEVESGKIEMQSYALVRQESGEDWEDVELTFSAAEPARAADLPELLAWHIGEAQGPQVVLAIIADGESPAQSNRPARRASRRPAAQAAQSSTPAPSQEALADLKQEAESAGAVLALNDKSEGKPILGGKAARTRELLRTLDEQRKQNDLAAQKKDWDAFVVGNCQVMENIQQLDRKYQAAFSEELAEANANIQSAQRILKSARLVDGLVEPVRSSRGYDYKYRALRRETIPSDGAFNKVVVGQEEFPAEFVYETAPLARELCFLTSRIKNQRRQPYLEGPASVFLGPDFVGDGRVPTTARGEEFKVELGADEAVVVKRREDRKRETTGVFTSYHKYRHEVEVTVKNQKKRPVQVAVIDRVPFSEDRGLEVERRSVSPPVTAEERRGLLRWSFPLEPGGERKVTFSYTVELAADKQIAGVLDKSVEW